MPIKALVARVEAPISEHRQTYDFVALPRPGDTIALPNNRGDFDAYLVERVEHWPHRDGDPVLAEEPRAILFVRFGAEIDFGDNP